MEARHLKKTEYGSLLKGRWNTLHSCLPTSPEGVLKGLSETLVYKLAVTEWTINGQSSWTLEAIYNVFEDKSCFRGGQ